MPPALGRFSTMIVWPRGLLIACAMTRATVSVGPPAAYGTSMVMFLVGYCCANALAQNAIDALNAATNEIRFIVGFGGQYSDPLSYGRFGEDAQDSPISFPRPRVSAAAATAATRRRQTRSGR